MGRMLAILGSTIALLGLAVGISAIATAGSDVQTPLNVHVIEHASTDTVIDIGDPGDSTGDLLTFHNDVYDRSDSHVLGHDQGDCIRIDPAGGSWECRWVTILSGGSITVEGQFLDTEDTVLAVTGGTGIYRNARGQMQLKSRNGGAEYDFIFRLRP